MQSWKLFWLFPRLTRVTQQTMQPIVAPQNTHMSGRTETFLSPRHSFEVIFVVCQKRDSLWALGWRGNYTYLLSSFVSVQPSLLQEQRRGVFVLGEGPGAAAPQHSTCQLLPRSLQEPVSALQSIREIAQKIRLPKLKLFIGEIQLLL